EERLGRRNQNVRRFAAEARALNCRSVSGANSNGWNMNSGSRSSGGIRDAGQRRAKVAFHIDGERLQRRDIQDATALLWRRRRLEHQAIQAPEECRQRLATPRGRQYQRRFAARDCRPAKLLGARRRLERGGKPLANGRVEEVEYMAASHHTI